MVACADPPSPLKHSSLAGRCAGVDLAWGFAIVAVLDQRHHAPPPRQRATDFVVHPASLTVSPRLTVNPLCGARRRVSQNVNR